MKDTTNNSPETENRDDIKEKSEIWEYIRIIVAVVLIVGAVNSFFLLNARIPSDSMENTITKGDQLFGNRLAYRNKEPERYDIVIFRFPDDESQLFIKRVIGLPGETVTITDGEVYINDDPIPLDDSFLPEKMEGDFGPYEVPESCYFMMGDNRNWSNDSRFWQNTYVRRDQILAKAVLRYWPLNKIGFVE